MSARAWCNCVVGAYAAATLVVANAVTAADSGVPEGIRALERSAGGSVRAAVSPHNGAVTFLRAPRGGLVLAVPEDAAADDRARAFLRASGPSLRLPDADETIVVSSSEPDEAGMEHVRLQQQYGGIPVRFGELTVHLRGPRLAALHAKTVTDADQVDLTPAIEAADAAAKAAAVVRDRYDAVDATFTDPRLELFNRGLVEHTAGTTRLAWFVSAQGPMLNALVWIDAHEGDVLFALNQVPDAKFRRIYDAFQDPFSPLPGTLIGDETSPPTSPQDAVDVFEFMGDTYDYFLTEHGRDGYDGAGTTPLATVRYCNTSCGCPCFNAFSAGALLLFGMPPFTMDDIVGHEWMHGVTQETAGLIYYKASGALNESFSDIFGESIDLTNSGGHDPPEARWRIAEASYFTLGIRNMYTPEAVPGFDPPKMSDSRFECSESDSGGVHTNSAIGNHAYALMVDGGTFNGFTINGIGLTKAAKIQYRALTQYLTSTSGYPDHYDAAMQSCDDLIGLFGITAADCVEVQKALDSVEMYAPWPCTCGNGVVDPDEQCDDGNQIDGDCCSSLCQSANPGDACSDGDNCTQDDTCQVAGPALACVGTDGPRVDCRGSVGTNTATISIRDKNDAAKDHLLFRYSKGLQTTKAEFGDPTSSTSYALCLYKEAVSTPVHDIALTAGGTCAGGAKNRPCWTETKGGFRYRDRFGSIDGVVSMLLKEGVDGRSKIVIRGKGLDLAPPSPGSLDADLTAQVVSSEGVCWDAEFPQPAKRQTSEVYSDRGE